MMRPINFESFQKTSSLSVCTHTFYKHVHLVLPHSYLQNIFKQTKFIKIKFSIRDLNIGFHNLVQVSRTNWGFYNVVEMETKKMCG